MGRPKGATPYQCHGPPQERRPLTRPHYGKPMVTSQSLNKAVYFLGWVALGCIGGVPLGPMIVNFCQKGETAELLVEAP